MLKCLVCISGLRGLGNAVETEVFKYISLNFYIAKAMLRILLKFVQLTLKQ